MAADVLENARSLIQDRLDEVAAEAESLENALKELGGTTPAKRASKPAGKRSAAPKRKATKRAAKGQRKEEFLSAIRAKPGITVAEAAKKMGVDPPNAVYGLASKLLKEKVISKKGKAGYEVKPVTSAKAKEKKGAAKAKVPA